jgi:hypothetical protein
MNDRITRNPIPNPTSYGVGIGVMGPLTQATKRTGAVFRVDATAEVAPVSSTLLVNTIRAPANKEYFVSGKIIVLNNAKGLAPRILEASSKSIRVLSTADDMALTK